MKIENKGNKIIFTGHEQTKEQCELTTLLCDALSNSNQFKTIRYENGYAEFEKVGEAKELRFAQPNSTVTMIFDSHIQKVTSNNTVDGSAYEFTASGETTPTGTLNQPFTANVILDNNYIIDTVIVSPSGATVTDITNNSFIITQYGDTTVTITSKQASTTPSPIINLDNLARFKSKLEEIFMGIKDVAANPGSYTAILSTITIRGTNYNILPQASSTALGGIRIGYTQSGKNYPVQVSSNGQAYVNVPWVSATAQNIYDLTEDSETVVREIDSDTGKVQVHLTTSATTKLNNSLQLPTASPSSTQLVAIGTNKAQTNILIGEGLNIEGNTLKATGGSSQVVANPSGMATYYLRKLQVGNSIYGVPTITTSINADDNTIDVTIDLNSNGGNEQ